MANLLIHVCASHVIWGTPGTAQGARPPPVGSE